jgi:tRNA1Val (adenine37-N6)-methyltransferase
LKENERIDDLEFKGLKIIQDKNGFCFGIDSVLLSDYAKNLKNKKVIDLGTGTGIINILLSGKTENCEFTGIEIQPEVADMAERSIKLNNLENKIKIINNNILELKNIYKKNSFDVVVTNPPYKKINTGVVNVNDKKIISRHEITASLEDFIEIASFLLKDFGEFYMVHRPDRLVDIFNIMREKNIEPKKIKFVYPNKNKKTNLVLIKGIKNGKPFLEFENNLYVYDSGGNYTEDILKIYNKNV